MRHRRDAPPGTVTYVQDPATGQQAELRAVSATAAVKAYACPGCNQQIPRGTGHVVVVPLLDPGERRHWHRACWDHRHRRRPGR